MIEDVVARLAASGIHLLPATETHLVVERGGLAALVERTAEGFGQVGSSGLLTEGGFAALVWRAGNPVFVRQGYQQPATEEQIRDLRRFAADVAAALAG